MSYLWKCPIYGNVLSMEMYYLWKCPINGNVYLWNEISMKCHFYKMSCLWNGFIFVKYYEIYNFFFSLLCYENVDSDRRYKPRYRWECSDFLKSPSFIYMCSQPISLIFFSQSEKFWICLFSKSSLIFFIFRSFTSWTTVQLNHLFSKKKYSFLKSLSDKIIRSVKKVCLAQ